MLLPDYFSESALVARLPPGCLFSEKKFKELMNDLRHGNNISILPKYDEVIKFLISMNLCYLQNLFIYKYLHRKRESMFGFLCCILFKNSIVSLTKLILKDHKFGFWEEI